MKLQRFLIIALTLALAFAIIAPARAQDDTATTTLYITEDGAFSVQLPEGWYAAGDVSGLQIANDEAALTSDNFEITESGDLGLIIIPLAKADLAGFGLAEDATILDVATALAPNFAGEDGTTTVGDPESLADTVVRLTIVDDTNDGVIYVADNLAPGYLGIAIMAAPKGEMTEDAEAEILGLLTDLNYSLVLDQTFEAADGALTFSYPTDWVTTDVGGAVAALTDSQTTLDNMDAGTDIAAGESRLAVIGIAPANAPADLSPEGLQAFAVQAATELASSSESNPVMGDPELLENEALVGGSVVYVPVSSDIGEGGIFLVNNEGVLHLVLFSGAVDEGNRVYGTALNIANSTVYTPAE